MAILTARMQNSIGTDGKLYDEVGTEVNDIRRFRDPRGIYMAVVYLMAFGLSRHRARVMGQWLLVRVSGSRGRPLRASERHL